MLRTRKVRQTKVISQKSDEISDEEIENTNSSIVEITKVSQTECVSITSSDNEEEKVKPKRRSKRLLRGDEQTISISALSKRLVSRSNSELLDQKQIVNVQNNDTSWVDKYTPSNSSEIAMHPKKLNEIKTALKDMIQGSADFKILLLTGPAGSGKSTATKILADELMRNSDRAPKNLLLLGGMSIDSIDEEDDAYVNSGNDRYQPSSIVEYINAISSSVDQFPNFLNESKLLTGPNLRVILVEDLPNVFHLETKLRFQKSLRDWLSFPGKLPPLVICISENEFNDDFANSEMSYNIESNFVAETIIGLSLLNHGALKRIKVNPIAKTYLKKLLVRILKNQILEFIKINKTVVNKKIDNLSLTGDIRSSINCLEFWVRYYASFEDKGDLDSDDFLSFGKENSLNLFNAIGKIIYGTSHEDTEIINYKKINNAENQGLDSAKIDQITITNVLNNFSNKSTFFNLNLLENYSALNNSSFPICDELDQLVDNLSISDILNNNNLFDIGSNVSIRSTRYKMRDIDSKIKNGYFNIDNGSIFSKYKNNKLSFSRYYKFLNRVKLTKSDIKNYQFWKFNKLSMTRPSNMSDYGPMATSLSSNDAIMVDGFYEASILNSVKNENQIRDKLCENWKVSYVPSSAIPKFPRLGGSFTNKLWSDSQIYVEDDFDHFSKIFENYKTAEEKLMGVIITGLEGDDGDSEESEFDEDPIDDDDDDDDDDRIKEYNNTSSNKINAAQNDKSNNSGADEFIDDFNDDDSFEDEPW